MVHGEGSKVVDDQGRPLILRGCNLGNWLIVESWMLGWENVGDQTELAKTLTDRFGADQSQRLITMYRDGYITPRDFELIKSFGFNLVRVPFDSRMLIDDAGKLVPDAFKYLDRALEMAERAGMYVILDMHGAPGSQSKQDHTGQRDQNKLWSDPANQTKMIALWKQIAERYKNRSVVAAYDLLNEPYGDFQTDYRAPLRALMPRVYESIRSTGDKHLVIFPNGLGTGPTFYDDPKAKGMEQVAFTDHYYAGLFGSPSTVRSHAGMFERTMPEAQHFLDRVGSPMLIGEFNVVLAKAGGDAMMRHYFDEFARRGWMATMWSYKSLKPAAGIQDDNWYLVSNADALPKIDVKTSSLAKIEGAIGSFSTMPLVVDEKLKSAITSAKPQAITLPKLEPLPESAPKTREAGKWKLVDVATDRPAGLIANGGDLSLVTAGTDIFADHDSFSFLQQPAPQKAVLTATLDRLADSDTWAKAGLMLRFGDPVSSAYPSAPFVMLNLFTDGGIAFVTREKAGGRATETKRIVGPLPRKLAIARDGDRVDAYVDDGANGWIKVGSTTITGEAKAQIGLAACSHRGTFLTQADFRDVSLTNDSAPAGTIQPHASSPLDANSQNALSLADWNSWGDGFRREDGQLVWTSGNGESGQWRDFAVEPGKAYAFSIRVCRTDAGDKKPNLSIAFESTDAGHQVALAERAIETDQLETGDGWSVVQVKATAMSNSIRVLIRAGSDASGGGLVFDGATFEPEKSP